VGFICELEGNSSLHGRRATNFAAYQKETKDDTSDEQPPADVEGDRYAVLCLGTVVEDLVRPLLGGQHGDGRENIQDIDKEVLKHDNVEPHVPGGEGIRKERVEGVQISARGVRYSLGSHAA
jgi:hypothetical protein